MPHLCRWHNNLTCSKKKHMKNQHDNLSDPEKERKPVTEGEQGKVDPGHGSTTQGGQNFGQGSQDLGKDSIKQGSESSSGSNYEKGLNEQ